MAIFGTKKDKDIKVKAVKPAKAVKATKEVAVVKKAPVEQVFVGDTAVIIRPRVTEKSGLLSQGNVYTFEVAVNANKNMIAKAVTSMYKVTPLKVAIINTPTRNVFIRGRKGKVSGIRKAMVTIKKGEKIDFV